MAVVQVAAAAAALVLHVLRLNWVRVVPVSSATVHPVLHVGPAVVKSGSESWFWCQRQDAEATS
jgi:hypothetical protein